MKLILENWRSYIKEADVIDFRPRKNTKSKNVGDSSDNVVSVDFTNKVQEPELEPPSEDDFELLSSLLKAKPVRDVIEHFQIPLERIPGLGLYKELNPTLETILQSLKDGETTRDEATQQIYVATSNALASLGLISDQQASEIASPKQETLIDGFIKEMGLKKTDIPDSFYTMDVQSLNNELNKLIVSSFQAMTFDQRYDDKSDSILRTKIRSKLRRLKKKK
jgi:hypothetical protein